MSQKSQERHHQKIEYFKALKETAEAVDFYVKEFIQHHFQINPELYTLLISRYRFGKPQLRPAQVRFAYELVSGENWKKVIPACASLELKDTGYYCYDDFLDKEENINLLLLGGIFNSLSYAVINDLFASNSSLEIQKTLEELSKLDRDTFQATLIDLNLRLPNEELYMNRVKGYNFWEHALRIGGILSGASEDEISKLGIAGQKIGMAYIIANDTWDFGKTLEDFRAGKYTLPIIWAFGNINLEDRKTLEFLLGENNLSKEQIDLIRKIMVRSGAIDYGKDKAKVLCAEGIEVLSYFPDCSARRMLEFSTTMTQRNKYYSILEEYR